MRSCYRMEHYLLAAALMLAASPAMAQVNLQNLRPPEQLGVDGNSKQQRYEEMLHAKFDFYLRQYDDAVAKAKMRPPTAMTRQGSSKTQGRLHGTAKR